MAFFVVLVIMTMVMIVRRLVGGRFRLVVGVMTLHDGMLARKAVRN